MDWTMIQDGLFALGGFASGGFLAFGGWLCMRHLFDDLGPFPSRASPDAPHWSRTARAS